MLNNLLKYGLYFFVLVLVQVLVLNNVQFSGFINPYIYILFILVLPFETPGWLLLISAFALGFTIDIFPQGIAGGGGTLGVHTAATVLAAFIRPTVLKWINARGEYESGTLPSARDYGIIWYLLYALIITGIHHFVLFYLEDFSLRYFFNTFARFTFSLIFTLILIFIWEGFRFRPKKSF